MLKSVYQNGGFYIGKYETGIEDAPKISGSSSKVPTETPVIKPNAYPYNFVTCSQAQTLASNMESGDRTTSLLFGVQWDLTLKYLEKKGTSQADLKEDSTSWGNYKNKVWAITNENLKYYIYSNNQGTWTSNKTERNKGTGTSILLSTGADETFSKQGIYDFAGNVKEWTLEYTANTKNPCSLRSGGYSNEGSKAPANYRDENSRLGTYVNVGFRITLY